MSNAPSLIDSPAEHDFSSKKFRNFSASFLIVAIFVLIGAYRLSLLDRGALSIPDELQYWEAGDAIEKIFFDHDIRGGFAHLAGKTSLFGSTDKPAHITLRLLPFTIQGLIWKLSGGIRARDPETGLITSGVHFRNPEFMKIPMLFNWAVSLGILAFFYKISRRLFKGDPVWAGVSTLVYGLLANSNIYVRHILPYDHGLLFFLAGFYCVLKKTIPAVEPLSFGRCAAAGLLSGFAFTVYPGYYIYPFLTFAVIALRPGEALFSKAQFARYIGYGGAAFSVLCFYEIVARIGGLTYFGNLRNLSGSLDGSPEEGLTYVPEYLWRVEGIAGVFLGALALAWIFSRAWTFLRRADLRESVYDVNAAPYILMAFGGLFFHALVTLAGHWAFYGRVIHAFMPFMVWAAMAFLADLPLAALPKKIVLLAIPLISLLSFFPFARAYANLAYPMDVLYKLGIDTGRLAPGQIRYESSPYTKFASPPPRNFKTGEPYSAKTNFLLVNFCFFHLLPPEDFTPVNPPKNARLIYQNQHMNAVPAYLYEGGTLEKRRLIKDRKYQLSVYELGDPGN